MKQAIAGVSPPQSGETEIMTVFPSLSAWGIGRALGQLWSTPLGLGGPLTLGNLLALLSIPVALPLYFAKVAPGLCRRYTLTNRRVVVRRGLLPTDERSVSLDNFDAIDVEVQPGQAWYKAGDLIFRKGPVETFRISGVVRPETFRHTCLKAQRAHTGVQKALQLVGAAS